MITVKMLREDCLILSLASVHLPHFLILPRDLSINLISLHIYTNIYLLME
jgi:hypothetical protein